MKPQVILLSLMAVAVAIAGCGEKTSGYTDISVKKARELIEGRKVFLLDVRTPQEYSSGHIKGAYLIPLQELEDRLNEIPKDQKILVYCRTGHRSAIASQILAENGFDVLNMKGGIVEWINKGYEVVR